MLIFTQSEIQITLKSIQAIESTGMHIIIYNGKQKYHCSLSNLCLNVLRSSPVDI